VNTGPLPSREQIEARFPRPSIEKQKTQVTRQAETAGQTDGHALCEVLRRRQNRYLARLMCWVLMVQGLETYILQPRDPMEQLDSICCSAGLSGFPWISQCRTRPCSARTTIACCKAMSPPRFWPRC
jgi:PatG Domain